jgi:thymidylate kinase
MTQATALRTPAAEGEPSLAVRLARALQESGMQYCQWKGRAKHDRWVTGRGDLDLLVERGSAGALASAFQRLDFKQAFAPPDRQVAGVHSFVGFDRGHGRLIHVHAHFALVVGRPWVRSYRLPFADAVVRSAVPGAPFPVPAPEFELLLLLLRTTLLHDPRDLLRSAEPPWLRAARAEYSRLRTAVAWTALRALAAHHLPDLDPDTLERCAGALAPKCPSWRRLAARVALERVLASHGRRPSFSQRARRAVMGAARAVGLTPETNVGKRLASGGAIIALVGADGAGKSTCARALRGWLGTELSARRAHLGRPPRSALTLMVGGALKAARGLDALQRRPVPGGLHAHLELLRYACTARDRYRLYREVRRFAAEGGVAICERYPMPGNRMLVGPSRDQGRGLAASSRLARALRRWEARCYARMVPPELVFVLRVEPEVAVQRKVDEPADYVRARAWAMLDTDWSGSGATIVDANRPIRDILTELRARVWEAL